MLSKFKKTDRFVQKAAAYRTAYIALQYCSNATKANSVAGMSSSQMNKMTAIIDLWDYELERNNAGAFGMQYIVSHPTTRIQNRHVLKTTALFQQIMGFMACKSGKGLSEVRCCFVLLCFVASAVLLTVWLTGRDRAALSESATALQLLLHLESCSE